MDEDYLKNNICKFTPLFKINYGTKKNILSACFFKVIGKGYKDFSIYVDGLIKLNNLLTKLNLNYKIRLFIDNSIYNDTNLFDKITKLKNVEPILYSCKNYIVNDNYHEGLFGTLVRFFPFFNFPNNDANTVVIVDIDVTNISIFKNEVKLLKTNKYLSKFFNNIYLFKSGPLYKSTKYNFDIFYKDKLNPYVFASSYFSIKRINSDVLINFFNKINSVSPEQNVFSYLDNPDPNIKIKQQNANGKFIYGTDEYFLNKTLGNYLIDNKMCYAVNTFWDVFGCLYYVLSDFEKLTDSKIKLIDLMFKYIYEKLDWKFVENENIKVKFDKLDKIIFSKNKENDETKYKINYLFYKLFLFFRNNKNYKFIYPENYYKLLVDDEKYFGVHSIKFIRVINCVSSDKDIILEENKFTQKDIDKLKKFYLEEYKSSNTLNDI
jgi:hypothetical protein